MKTDEVARLRRIELVGAAGHCPLPMTRGLALILAAAGLAPGGEEAA